MSNVSYVKYLNVFDIEEDKTFSTFSQGAEYRIIDLNYRERYIIWKTFLSMTTEEPLIIDGLPVVGNVQDEVSQASVRDST